MRKITLFALSLMVGSMSAYAQEESVDEAVMEEAPAEESAPLSISGSVDAYFRQNITAQNESGAAPGSSFANQPGFALGMVNLIAAHEGEKAGFVADLVFGPRGSDAVFASPQTGSTSSSIVNQLYAYWNISDAVTLTIGNFNTFLGYEVISPTANFNYSTSYMFSYGPFSHTGIKADIALTDQLSVMVSVMNPTDMTEFNPGDTYILGFQLGYSNDAGGAWLNVRYGDEDGKLEAEDVLRDGFSADDIGNGTASYESAGSTFQVDLTTGWSFGDFYVGFNGTVLTVADGTFADTTYDAVAGEGTVVIEDVDGAVIDPTGFVGAAIYLQYSFSDAFALGIRGESFTDLNGYALGTGDLAVIDLTLSAQYTVGGLTLIPEVRLDAASEDVFPDTDGEPTSSLASFVLGAVYAF